MTETTIQNKTAVKKKLEWSDLWEYLGMERDNGGRWYYGQNTPESVVEYLSNYRTPSRAWPNSYAKPMLTMKFAKFLLENEPHLAAECGL